MKKLLSFFVFFSLVMALTSCYKVHHHYITKGVWYIDAVELNGGSTNFMESFLPDFKLDTSFYKVYLLENGLARGEYYTNDSTLNYFITGEWELLNHDEIYLKADQYIDGNFLIELAAKDKMILSTLSNNVAFENIGDVAMVVRISRDSPGSQDDTRP
tara:strand:- start:2506 stop:2979 length:474 start_codon:yes stop_codon:yes gene_type:complete